MPELDVNELQSGMVVFSGDDAGETIDAEPSAVVNTTDWN